jgi:hypothetical protein
VLGPAARRNPSTIAEVGERVDNSPKQTIRFRTW